LRIYITDNIPGDIWVKVSRRSRSCDFDNIFLSGVLTRVAVLRFGFSRYKYESHDPADHDAINSIRYIQRSPRNMSITPHGVSRRLFQNPKCLFYTNICTNNCCNFISNYSEIFRVNTRTPSSGSLQLC